MSRSVDLAKELVNQFNTVNFLWPSPDPTIPLNPIPHLVTDYAETKACVIPQIKRTESEPLRILVAPPADSRRESNRDRCGRQWKYALNVAVVQRIDKKDADLVQPMTLARIDALMGFAEAIADFIDANRQLPAMRATCTELTQLIYSETELRDHHLFISTTAPVYTINV